MFNKFTVYSNDEWVEMGIAVLEDAESYHELLASCLECETVSGVRLTFQWLAECDKTLDQYYEAMINNLSLSHAAAAYLMTAICLIVALILGLLAVGVVLTIMEVIEMVNEDEYEYFDLDDDDDEEDDEEFEEDEDDFDDSDDEDEGDDEDEEDEDEKDDEDGDGDGDDGY